MRDRRQRFSAEAIRRQTLEVFKRGNLARSKSFTQDRQIGFANAGAIVLNSK